MAGVVCKPNDQIATEVLNLWIVGISSQTMCLYSQPTMEFQENKRIDGADFNLLFSNKCPSTDGVQLAINHNITTQLYTYQCHKD